MKKLTLAILSGIAIVLGTRCKPASTSELPALPSQSSAPVAIPAPAAPPGDYVVLVTDPRALKEIEASGGALGDLVDAPRYASIVESVKADVAAARAADPQSGPTLASAHRLFDAHALTSKEARFELIAVSNRLDRMHVAPSACGEVRFVYRLTYATSRGGIAIASRLPATLAVSFWSRSKEAAGDCQATAERWRQPRGLDGKGIADWLFAERGPVGPSASLRARFKSVEANLQLVRWPSTVRPDLGGHAEYLMRSFVASGHALVAGPLENTPDVAKLKKDPALRAELLQWLGDEKNLHRVDIGTAIIPDEFLATRAVSVSPRGLARRANRPFRQLFDPASLASLDRAPGTRRYAKEPAAVLRRLDELSCQGCHQSRSVAGFHLLGEEVASGANALAVGMSPHLLLDLARRKHRIDALDDDAAPLAERGDDETGRYGAHCGLGAPRFASWTCASGLRCTSDDSNPDDTDVGICLPETPGVGDPCEAGVISSSADPHADKVTRSESRPCGATSACESNLVGFPGGMCEGACASRAENGICAGIPILIGFNACLAKKTPFEQCIAENTTPGLVRACSASAPCRDDYVCARTANGGACMPPYFLFQLRVDGHPSLP